MEQLLNRDSGDPPHHDHLEEQRFSSQSMELKVSRIYDVFQ